MTLVISVRGRGRYTIFEPKVFYVGRAVPRLHWRRSEFANPFRVQDYESPAACLEHYNRTLFAMIAALADPAAPWPRGEPLEIYWIREQAKRFRELRGRVLGCMCGDWQPGEPKILCHAVTLAELADSGPPG